MKNWAISTVRSAYYAVTEPRRLRNARLDNLDGWAGVWDRGDPLVSVIVPTHNRRKLLENRALRSVLSQTYRNVEVLVCAHGCTDGTVEVINSLIAWYQSRDDIKEPIELRLIEVPRRQTYPSTAENHWFAGPVDPINAGLKAARGKWIARIDDDDTWTPDHIEKLLRFAQLDDYEFVSAAYMTPAGGTIPYRVNGYEVGGVQTWLYRGYLRFMKANPDCWRKRWNRVNDTDLQQRFVDAGVRVGYLDKVVAHISPRPGETAVGLKAYQQNRAETERKLAFR